MEHEPHYHRRSGVFGPLLLVGAGVMLLLSNLGWLDWNVWAALLRLWPLLLVALGIDILIGRRSLLGAVVSAILIVALLGSGIWLALSGRLPGVPGGETLVISHALDGVESASVTLSPAVAALNLTALNDSSNLIEGSVRALSGERIYDDFGVDAGRARVEVRSGGTPFNPSLGSQGVSWDLGLNDSVPLTLDVNGGVGEVTLDLSRFELERLDLDMGVGRVRVYLPDSGQYNVSVNGGVGQLEIFLPEGLGTRITADTGLGDLTVPAGFSRNGDVYTSAGYNDADDHVMLNLNMAIGEVAVRYTEEQ